MVRGQECLRTLAPAPFMPFMKINLQDLTA